MKIFVVDAFADRPFSGNPAAICLSDDDCDANWMQSVAVEMNLSETAFVRKQDNGFGLRWFTPAMEVDLCGHATLASAHVLWQEGLVTKDQAIPFHTRSGVLACSYDDGMIEMDFPATPPKPAEPPPGLIEALGVEPSFVGESKYDKFVVVDSEEAVRSAKPDFGRLGQIPVRGVIVTSRSNHPEFDFVSRYFAPAAGIDEDPVTGSAHCCLGPYWGDQLGKTELNGFQASPRGGAVKVRVAGDRVFLGGRANTFLRGALNAGDTSIGDNNA